MQLVAVGAPPQHDPAPDRVGRARAGSVRAYAPPGRPREAVVRWATRHAHRTGADLQVLVDDESAARSAPRSTAGLLVRTVQDLAARAWDLVPHPPTGRLGRSLVGAAAGVRLLVLPAGLPELEQIVASAPEPVVVVPDRPLPETGAPVVLGLGSDTGAAVVGTAFEVAARYGVPLHVVRASGDPAAERQAFRDDLAAWRLARPEVAVDVELVGTDPVDVLQARSSRAQLLVVGRSTRGVVRRWVSPSPAVELLHTAGCPVAVVPDAGR